MKSIIKKISLVIILSFLTFLPLSKLNAASGSISVKSNKSSVVVGNSFNVSITVSSSSPIGAWEYSLSYDSSKVKLSSGEAHVVDYGDGSKKSVTYNYTFKALSKGASTISVKSYSILGWDESKLSVSAGSTTVKAITQEELEASYSKNNNLKSLSVEGYEITPGFSKDNLEYSLKVGSSVEKIVINAQVEDGSANLSGTGEVAVSEGDNRFEIKVTAQNGSEKTYVLNVNVEDENPIETIIDGVKYSVIKRLSTLEAPATFEQMTVKINDIEVPGFFSNITNYTLVGLKDSNGNVKYAVYDESDNTYQIYKEIKTEGIVLYPLKTDKTPKYFKKAGIVINEEKVEAFKFKNNEEFYLVYGVNVENDNKGFYIYDVLNNSFAKYNEDIIKDLEKKLDNFILIIIVLGSEILVVTSLLLISFTKKNKRRNNQIKAMEMELDKEIEKQKDNDKMEDVNIEKTKKKNKSKTKGKE